MVWRNTLLEVEPGIRKRAGDCKPDELDKVEEILQEKDVLIDRIAAAQVAIWAHIDAHKPLPELPAWWVFAPELAWTDLISMRAAATALETVVTNLD